MTETSQSDRVVSPPAKDPAVRLFIVAAMLLGFGIWCFLDAYVQGKYPRPENGADFNAWADYYFNHVGGIVLPLAGLVPLLLALRFLRRPVIADAEGLGYKGGRKIRWEEVGRLDATDLAKKGILRLHYGPEKPLVLDSWKLTNFKALVDYVDSHVPDSARPDTN